MFIDHLPVFLKRMSVRVVTFNVDEPDFLGNVHRLVEVFRRDLTIRVQVNANLALEPIVVPNC